MGYRKQDGQWANTVEWTPAATGTEITETGTSAVIENGDKGTVRLTQTTSATAGTSPTLDVKVQTCHTEDGTFRDVHEGAFTQITDVGTESKSVGGLDRFTRLYYTLGGSGTPIVTLGIDGEFC